MPSGDHYESHHTHKPNWVDIATSIVLVLTLLGIWDYACTARHSNELTNEALDFNTRPYIQITSSGDPSQLRIKAGQTLTMGVYLYNWGRLPARTRAQGIMRYSRTRLPNASNDGLRTLPEYYIWPGTYVNGIPIGGDWVWPESPDKLTDGDITDIKVQRGWIYVEVEVSYRGRYITRICDEYPLKTDGPLLKEFALCSDPQSNCTDEECK